jgi:uncharacterized protein
MKNLILLFVIFFSISIFSQENIDITINPLIKGTLIHSKDQMYKTNLVIFIAGSGPTDRNGNQKGMVNNSLKFLAEGIVDPKTDVFRFDKSIIAQIAAGKIDETKNLFQNNIDDVLDIIKYFRANYNYKKIIIAGHSEGSLVGMVAANGNVDGFISLAGAGRSADLIVDEQVAKQMPEVKDEVHADLEMLKKGQTFENKNPNLAMLFRASVQPYLISWFKFNPQNEIKKLKIPVLIINGTKDIQVSIDDAKLLNNANPSSKLELIENMNHLFKEIKGDNSENMASYSNPSLPVSKGLILKIKDFLKSF